VKKPKPIVMFLPKDPEGNSFDVYYADGHKVGEVAKEVDGFFYFCPEPYIGTVPAHALRGVADELDRLNKSRSKQVNASPTITTP
jgi:hypothetical protein